MGKESDVIGDALLDVWFVKRNNQPQPFIADAAIPEQGLNAILKRRVDNGCKCTLQLRFSNDIDNNYALSMLESAFILGYTNIIILEQGCKYNLDFSNPCQLFSFLSSVSLGCITGGLPDSDYTLKLVAFLTGLDVSAITSLCSVGTTGK